MSKKNLKIIGLVCLACILMIATLSACSNDSGDGLLYNVTSFQTHSADIINITDEPQTIVTYEQFAAFCSEAEMPINDKSGWNYDSDIYKKFRSYDKKFFKNKSLIVLLIAKSHPQDLQFGNLNIKDDTLIINILNEFNPYESGYDYPAVMDYHLFLIEINKNSISNVNQIVVKEYNHLN